MTLQKIKMFEYPCNVCKNTTLFRKDHNHAICDTCGTLHRECKIAQGTFYEEIILPKGNIVYITGLA
jgi:ribosomal protein L37AE/L43A